jgi:FkbH-like protein
MWLTDWAESGRVEPQSPPVNVSAVEPSSIASTYLLAWNEHCLECALPDCFAVCSLYVRRRDRKCARFKRGILPNPQYPGLYPFGAEIEFRRWGKLESTFGYGAVSVSQARLIDKADQALLQCVHPISRLFRTISPALRLNGAYAVARELVLQSVTGRRRDNFQDFLIEVWNVKPEPVKMVLECWQEGLKFRSSILLKPGRTVQRIPADSMNVNLFGPSGMISVYPENDAEAHLIFSWLDFVRYKAGQCPLEEPLPFQSFGTQVRSADKVKCVVWDLDRTVWDGILGEQDPETVTLRPSVLRTMEALDERGILQSIASKNDYGVSWQVLQRLKISHLFLHPQINWEPKSVGIERIANALNIGLDSCALIDDSPFERAEVAHECGGVRVFSELEVEGLLQRAEFDVPVTDESKQRRKFYDAESQRRQEATRYGERYEAFLRTCEMQATIFKPSQPEHIDRCLELLHRSNQLNLSTHRYTREEFIRLLSRPEITCVCTCCRDRFGNYGLVGFASIDASSGNAVLKDFVLSCRVAQKKVESAWFRWAIELAGQAGYRSIRARYEKTSRNGVLLKALREVGFIERTKSEAGSELELDCRHVPLSSDIVSVEVQGFALPAKSESLLAAG